ncbi:MAG: hypothetical protein AB3N24_20840 [Leisingera sp.]
MLLTAMEVSYFLFIAIAVLMPLAAVALAYSRRTGGLLLAFALGAAALLITLGTRLLLAEWRQLPGYTGMEGLAFVYLPALFAGSVTASSFTFLIVRWLRRR